MTFQISIRWTNLAADTSEIIRIQGGDECHIDREVGGETLRTSCLPKEIDRLRVRLERNGIWNQEDVENEHMLDGEIFNVEVSDEKHGHRVFTIEGVGASDDQTRKLTSELRRIVTDFGRQRRWLVKLGDLLSGRAS